MNRRWSTFAMVAVPLLAALLCAPQVHAQDPPPPPDTIAAPDSAARPDSTRALSAASAAADSLLEVLLGLPGYTAVRYRGKQAEFRSDSGGVLRLEGEAEVTRQDLNLTADSITYWQRSKDVRAVGSPTFQGQQQQLAGEVLLYNLDTQRSRVRGARTKISQGADWYVTGDLVSEGTERLYATESSFTSDDREDPQYHFQAKEIKVIRDRLIVARPVWLYFKNVPVLPLPFIVQDMTQGRRSGLLTPEFSVNDIVRTSSGYTREISNLGFYWALNEYMGAELSGGWRSGSYTSLRSALQYRWRRQFLEGRLGARQFWRDGAGRELTLDGNTSWQPDERTRVAGSGSYASSSSFIRSQSTDPRESQNLTSNFSANRRFDWATVDLGARRSQSIDDGRVDLTLPQLGVSFTPLTFFRAAPTEARWYNNASMTASASASQQSVSVAGDSLSISRQQENTTKTNFAGRQSLTVGNLSLSTNASLNRQLLEGVLTPDTVLRERRNDDSGDWTANISYRIPLIGSTSVTPALGLSQSVARNERSEGAYVGAPMRLNFGASLSPSLFGFFPGVGPFSGIRHHVQPSIGYNYSPEVQQDSLQTEVFGRLGGNTQNVVTIGLAQTFEAKLRPKEAAEQAQQAQQADSLADTTGVQVQPAARPADAEKVTVLSLNTTAVGYDFVRASLGESGFTAQSVNNSIRSDFLQGLNIDVTHDLFDESGLDRSNPDDVGRNGKFAPHLQRLNASFSLGQNSGLVQRLLGFFGGGDEGGAEANPGLIPGRQEGGDVAPPGTGTFTQNPLNAGPRSAGGGPWNAQLSYSLLRPRADTSNLGGSGGFGGFGGFGGGEQGQTVNGTISFSPTPNWGVNWNTSYSITDGKFGTHRLNLRRDLYRWQADFDLTRTIYGNTSFSVSVRLVDLPDLKVDYRERDIGGRDDIR